MKNVKKFYDLGKLYAKINDIYIFTKPNKEKDNFSGIHNGLYKRSRYFKFRELYEDLPFASYIRCVIFYLDMLKEFNANEDTAILFAR